MHVPVQLHGVFSVPFRLFGIRPSRMNPNTCTICELMFTKVMRARKITIDATILFADLRGYTSLSQSQSPEAVSGLAVVASALVLPGSLIACLLAFRLRRRLLRRTSAARP